MKQSLIRWSLAFFVLAGVAGCGGGGGGGGGSEPPAAGVLDTIAKAAWPDEAARTAFFKKLDSYADMHHSDEIYTVMKSMQK